jgi:hypothetical protein
MSAMWSQTKAVANRPAIGRCHNTRVSPGANPDWRPVHARHERSRATRHVYPATAFIDECFSDDRTPHTESHSAAPPPLSRIRTRPTAKVERQANQVGRRYLDLVTSYGRHRAMPIALRIGAQSGECHVHTALRADSSGGAFVHLPDLNLT